MKGILQVIGLSPENVVLLVSSNYPEFRTANTFLLHNFSREYSKPSVGIISRANFTFNLRQAEFIYGVIFTNSELIKSS